MEVVDLVFRGRRPPEERESKVSERALARLPPGEVFTLHEGEVGALGTKRNPLAVAARSSLAADFASLPAVAASMVTAGRGAMG